MNTRSYVARKIVVLLALVAIVILSGARRNVQGQQWTGPDANGNISNTNSGKVGVGTSAPVNLLDVGSAAIGTMLGNAIVVSNTSGPSSVAVGQSVTARGRLKWNFSGTEANAYLSLGVSAGTNPLILQDAGGNVGIGTLTPTYKLSVEGSAYAVGGTGSPFYEGFRIRASDFATHGGYLLFGKQTGNGGYGVIQSGDNQNYRTLSLNPLGGNVGVGTTGPTNLLHINSGAIPSSQLRLSANGAGSLSALSHAPDNAALGFDVDWSTGTGWIARHSTVATLYKVGGKLQMLGWTGATVGSPIPDFTVHTSLDLTTGRFGIGVANPAYKLDVAGPVRSSSVGFVFPDGTVQATAATGGGTPSQWSNGNNSIYYNAGNVGLGTGEPAEKLEVAGSVYISGANYLRFPHAYGDVNDGKIGNSMFAPGLNLLGINNDNTFRKIQLWGQITQNQNDGTNSWAGTNYFSGNVGIGNNSPSTKLQVAGGTRIDGTSGRVYLGTTAVAGSRGLEFMEENATTFSIRHHDPNVAWQNIVINPYAGKVGIGTLTPTETLEVGGNIKASGTIFVKYQDLAEWVPSSEDLSAGTVVVLDQTKTNQVVSSTTGYDTRVAGVISAQPGIALGEGGKGKVLVATTGRVRVKVDASRGPIQIGDLLVTSDLPGVAMKSEAVNLGGVQIHRPGTIIGKALEPLAKGSGDILVLLSLQ